MDCLKQMVLLIRLAETHVGIIDIGYKQGLHSSKEYNYLERFSSTSANGISSIYKDICKTI